VRFSNSMIEAWFQSLKHQWLFLHQLDNLATLKRLTEFYVVEHNGRMSFPRFRGHPPMRDNARGGPRGQTETKKVHS